MVMEATARARSVGSHPAGYVWRGKKHRWNVKCRDKAANLGAARESFRAAQASGMRRCRGQELVAARELESSGDTANTE